MKFYYSSNKDLPDFVLKYHESYYNVELKVDSKPIFIEQLRMSPIDLEVTYRPRKSTDEEVSEVVRKLK